MVRPARIVVALVALLVAACSQPPEVIEPSEAPTHEDPLPSSTPFVAPPTPAPTDPIAVERPPMPSGFPVMAEAEPAAPDPNDPTVIARWYVPLGTYDVFAFYNEALPRAGFPIEGVYPGEGVGLIRFDEGTQILQVMLMGDLDQTDLVLRTDQP